MKTILVTGATGGIGSRVCKRLAKKGDAIILVSRSEEKLRQFALSLRKEYGRIFPNYSTDFAVPESVAGFTKDLKDKVKTLDGLVLVYPAIPKSTEIIPSAEVWRNAFELCFIQPLEVMKSALKLMSKGARIVIVSGIANAQVFPQLSMSNTIRSAWLAEAKTIAFNYGEAGVHINTVSLGGTLTEKFVERTENLSKILAGAIYEDIPANIPLGHYGDPEDAAMVIETMLSEFSSHMTGANILCDGGLIRRY